MMAWLRGLDLNQRPPGYEPDELPGCSTPRIDTTRLDAPLQLDSLPDADLGVHTNFHRLAVQLLENLKSLLCGSFRLLQDSKLRTFETGKSAGSRSLHFLFHAGARLDRS